VRNLDVDPMAGYRSERAANRDCQPQHQVRSIRRLVTGA